MAECKYCGGKVSFLRAAHPECALRYKNGKQSIISLVKRAGTTPNANLKEIKKEIVEIAVNNFVRDKELHELHSEGWKQLVRIAINSGNCTEKREKELVELAQQLFIDRSNVKCRSVWSKFETKRQQEKAKEAERERQRLLREAEQKKSNEQATILHSVRMGILPQPPMFSGTLPFNFMKSEQLIWLTQNVQYCETYRRSYWRRHERIFESKNVLMDTGLLGITSKHIYFAGPNLRFRIRYDRIIAFEPFSDGVGIQRAASSAKPQLFITDEAWFLYNLIFTLSQMM